MTVEHQPTRRNMGVPHALATAAAALQNEWAQIWFAVQREPWQALVLVPAAPGASSLGAARAMLDVAKIYNLFSIQLLDATGVRPEDAGARIADIEDSLATGERVIVAIDSPLTNPSSIPIARAATSALLLVPLATARTRDAQRSIDIVGRERFLGSVAMRARR